MFGFFRNKKQQEKKKDFFVEIADSVESGEYFEDMRKWYRDKYLSISSERVFMIIITIISVWCSFVILGAIGNIFPTSHRLPIVVEIEDAGNYYPRISRFVSSDANTQQANDKVKKFYIKQFVLSRETYDARKNFANLNAQQRFLQDYAARDIYEDFVKLLKVNNYSGWKVKYRNHTTREVTMPKGTINIVDINNPASLRRLKKYFPNSIKNKQFYLSNKNYYTAVVDFATKEIRGSKEKAQKWVAKVDFIANEIIFDEKTKDFLPFDFKVVSYEVKNR